MKFHISEGRRNAGLSEELEITETDGRFYSFTINFQEAKNLMKELQGYLPMEVCKTYEPSDMFRAQEDIKHLNLRLRKAEAKIVSLEGRRDALETTLRLGFRSMAAGMENEPQHR